jgi:single-stranded DNA-binding protein
MTTLALQKKADQVESFIKKAGRMLVEFQVAQAKWEIKHGKYKTFKSASDYMRHIRSKLKYVF